MDGGHLGRVALEALSRGAVAACEVESSLAGRADLESILEQATEKAGT